MNSNSKNNTPAASDMIIQTLNDYVEKYQNGVCLMELPTSIGKTYSTFEWIAQYAKYWDSVQQADKKKFRQIVFVTTMKKNLMTSEFDSFENDEDIRLGDLEKAYQRNGRLKAYKEEVMVLKSVADTLESILPILNDKENAIPTHYRDLPTLNSLRGHICKMTGLAAKTDREYYETKLKDASNAYFKLRKDIVKLYKDMNNFEYNVSLSEVAEDDNPWIFDMFPDLTIPKRKVLLMSFSKLLMGRLYEGKAKSFISDEFLKDKIIFVDEFDSTKKTQKDTLADNSILNAGEETDNAVSRDRHPFNFLQMFIQIYRGIRMPCASEDLSSLADKKESDNSSMITTQYLLKESDILNQNYLLDHAYLADEKLRDDRTVFIF